MFFSPNKFIFHSHRITTSDRYIQPDAANFNSWRRHMTLCGNTHDEKIIHAWEDVKAMFNGGTRKRLVGPNPSNSSNNNNNNNYNDNKNNNNKNNIDITNNKSANNNRNQSSLEANASAVDESACHSLLGGSDRQITICEETTCSKRTSIDHQYNYSTVAAAAVVGVTAVTTVPFNLHHSSLQSLRNEHDLSILPLSRNFVVDYMWHQQNNHNIPKKLIAGSDSFTGLESCPWIRPELSVASPATVACNTHQHQHGHHQLKTQVQINLKHETSPTAAFGVMKNRKLHLPDTTDSREISEFNIPSLLSSSAFKPVVGSAAVVSTSLYTARDSNSSSSTYIGPRQSTRTSTVLTHDCITSGTHRLLPVGNADATTVSGSDPSTGVGAILNTTSSVFLPTAPILTEQQNFAINNNERASNDLIDGKLEDDEEMVDIETTEDEAHDNSFNNFPPAVSSLSPIHSRSESPNVDVDGFTSDPDRDDHLDFKTHIRSFDNVKMYTQDKSEYKLDPLDSLDNEDDIYQEYTKTSEVKFTYSLLFSY
ncbi:phosphatidylinositol 3-kinase 2 [Drosophila busckii]|uniref:phosphatidylinositol 3-kinase 2 n=1 Tax=Drosophila busckii TaxID=30019 RepID=UPI00083EA479|nr:phosphatidylinositol 3-kinase 2 [Drosophila busckii]